MISRTSLVLLRAHHHRRLSQGAVPVADAIVSATQRLESLNLGCRLFSTTGGDGGGDDKNNTNVIPPEEEIEDVFGVNFEDGADKLGTDLPPKYKRDAATGRLTNEVEKELTDKEHKILNDMKDHSNQRERLLQDRITEHWDKNDDGGSDNMKWASDMGQAVREADMGLNVLGRSTQAQAKKEVTQDDGTPIQTDSFSQRLTKDEFEGFREYMKKQHKVEVSKDDIPVMENEEESLGAWKNRFKSKNDDLFADEVELSNKWLTSLAQRQMDSDALEDNPYTDLLPGDLTVSRFVSRKKAKQIPTELLHQNNIPLLKSFLTPTSQIKHRMHTRLGARDQRKISKLIRRARCMGLIPFYGQFTSEQHGWVHNEDMDTEREWEKQLKERGLVIKRSHPAEEDAADAGESSAI
mmetsp:Transcript_1194/g.1561  ORF Transcript_1194/g.1561 Transcript_1194/m.1561 type:complete len:409 (+) Transcript_1194:133-1359(+)|eukprot:CAMPEP_0198154458 /NCGR_PEP_ID=MMETSP1443-20131203/68602_1 /TAXON_ID=186043 /ORGANISM="Entomoneis sp., Strain CCMP2396" /LENGTH=408 /DNA_ID=CAMNT_0043821129 /DNA_START=56 /DNA_END=1282 /DNA_ORIENTATION=+